VATLRPLLRSFFGPGSSAGGDGTSARQWQRTGSDYPNQGYIRSHGRNGAGEAFELHDNAGKRIGVTTVIDHGNKSDDLDFRGHSYKRDDTSETSDPVADNWNSSQSNLAQESEQPRAGNGWNVMVKKTVVQTRGAREV
jgi:hypothetical protein